MACGASVVAPLAPPLAGQTAVPVDSRPVRWQLQAPSRLPGTGTLAAAVSATIADGWYLYSLTQPAGGPTRTVLEVLPTWRRSGEVQAPEPQPYPDRNFNIMSEVYTDSARFAVPVAATNTAGARVPLRIAVTYQSCTARYCLPPRTDTISADGASGVMASVERTREPSPAPRAEVPDAAVRTESLRATAATTVLDLPSTSAVAVTARAERPPIFGSTVPGTASLGGLVLAAMTTALLALLTPCVFPMIPITVGFFSTAADRSPARLRRDLVTFAAGIVGAFVLLGVGVSVLLGATGVYALAANPWLNLAIAALFGAFALQLAGVIRIGAPAALVTRLTVATHNGRGTAMLLLMGVTFALTSFTCTAPFVGSLLIVAASGGMLAPTVGLTAFALTFATPFVLLALMPSLASRLPRSGPWLDTLKRVAAFAELAVVVKFLSNAGMVWGWRWMTREVVIGAWLAVLLALIVWLAWSVRGQAVPSGARAPRAMGAAATALLAVWLATGLTGRRLGELEAYLPPRTGAALDAAGELPWTLNDWSRTVAVASAERRPILIDFTGYTCTNCRWMEANMFSRPAVRAALTRFERARLFTDGLGEPYRSQQTMQADRFGSIALPLYVIVQPDGRTAVAQYLGMTRDEGEFLAFLASAATGSE